MTSRLAIATLSLTLAQCAPAAPPANPGAAPPADQAAAPAAPAPPATTNDAMARVDAMLAETQKREAEYQQAVREARQPSTKVTVIDEHTPPVVTGGITNDPSVRGEESWWRAQAKTLNDQWAASYEKANDALQRANALSKQLKKRNDNYVATQSAYVAAQEEYQRASAALTRDAAAREALRQRAQSMNIPEDWVR